jgi:hypothetical protein
VQHHALGTAGLLDTEQLVALANLQHQRIGICAEQEAGHLLASVNSSLQSYVTAEQFSNAADQLAGNLQL